MSDVSLQLSDERSMIRADRLESGSPTWWVVLTRELSELWIWGKALTLIIL